VLLLLIRRDLHSHVSAEGFPYYIISINIYTKKKNNTTELHDVTTEYKDKTTERNNVSTEHKDIKLLNVMMYQPNIKT
jgi:hypothetical protein